MRNNPQPKLSNPRIYLAGPMTGLPGFNYAAFNAEAKRLRALGYYVENPAENIHPVDQDWAGYMRVALAQMLTCEAVALLPDWHLSRGACLENDIATQLGMPICDAAFINE
jgi:hypothetical protein